MALVLADIFTVPMLNEDCMLTELAVPVLSNIAVS